MSPIRVLLGALPDSVRTSVSQAVADRPDLDLIGVVPQPAELLAAAGALGADVVIVAAVAGELPGIATHLLDQHPDLRVLAVTGCGTALSFRLRPRLDEVACTTADELAEAIRFGGRDDEHDDEHHYDEDDE